MLLKTAMVPAICSFKKYAPDPNEKLRPTDLSSVQPARLSNHGPVAIPIKQHIAEYSPMEEGIKMDTQKLKTRLNAVFTDCSVVNELNSLS